jgi:phage shock protein PspC (stress-responsive transcriptional regulator)
MNRVSIVNLAGRAYHVEEAGVTAITVWQETARQRLAGDPDRDELLLDFERAIADRCEELVTRDRDVVTTRHVATILAALGAVEPANISTGSSSAIAEPAGEPDTTELPRTQPNPEPTATGWRNRKLYRLPPPEGRFRGVCAGIAAYLRIDVTMVRLATVALTFLTHGVAILAYVVLAVVLPMADTTDKRATARGAGITAEEMIARARGGAVPALQSLGSPILGVLRALTRIMHGVLVSIIWVVAAAWAVQVTWLFVNGGGLASAFDRGTSTWLIALWVTCLAWVVIVAALALNTAVALVAGDRDPRRSRTRETAVASVAGAATIVALIGIAAIPAANSRQLEELRHGHARVHAYGEQLCIGDGSFGGALLCHRGDHQINVGPG